MLFKQKRKLSAYNLVGILLIAGAFVVFTFTAGVSGTRDTVSGLSSGYNTMGELGSGDNNYTSYIYQNLVMDKYNPFVKLFGGYRHFLALDKEGDLWSWGYNYSGPLGTGTTYNAYRPVRVIKVSDIIEASGGYDFSIALDAKGTVWSWGANYVGQLGNEIGRAHV